MIKEPILEVGKTYKIRTGTGVHKVIVKEIYKNKNNSTVVRWVDEEKNGFGVSLSSAFAFDPNEDKQNKVNKIH